MARWLLVTALLLAGCSEPAAEDAPAETPAPPAPPASPPPFFATPEDESLVFYGLNVGAGMPADDGTCTFAGASTQGHSFGVREPAALQANLTWNLTAPGLITLSVNPPTGSPILVEQAPGSLERSLTYVQPEAEEGTWTLNVCSQGPSAVDYTIVATIDYP